MALYAAVWWLPSEREGPPESHDSKKSRHKGLAFYDL